MKLSCAFGVLFLLCVNVEFIVGKPTRYGAGIYTLPALTIFHQHMANERARNQAADLGSSSYLGKWTNPIVEDEMPMPRAPESDSDSHEISHQKYNLEYDDKSDNENGYASFKYVDNGMTRGRQKA